MDKGDIRAEWRKAYPEPVNEIEAIQKFAPGYNLGTDFYQAREIAIAEWWESQPAEDKIFLSRIKRERGQWV